MKSADDIKKFFNKLAIDTNPSMDKAVLDKILQAHEKATPAVTKPMIRSIIMKSPITRLAAAAVIIIACLTGLFLWKSTGTGIALADVLTRIEQVTGYMYQMNSTITKRGTTKNSTSTVLVSQDHGVKTIKRGTDPITGEIIREEEEYWLPRQNSTILVNHNRKTYFSFKFEDAANQNREEEHNDPRTIIKQFLSCDHTSLGQSVLDGITVEGFQTTDHSYKVGFGRQANFLVPPPAEVNVKIWVDVNTFLPVRTEEEIITKARTRAHYVSYDFRWNVVVNASDFEPNIPDDYTSPTGDFIFPAFDEENAIKGLRLFADAIGKYPASFERRFRAILREYRRHTGFDPNSYKELSDEEKTRKTYELASLGAPAFFYKTLVEEKKDPAYYGEMVGPEDAGKVLMRWKLDDGQYRVIFGDLSIKNVTPEELAELEKP